MGPDAGHRPADAYVALGSNLGDPEHQLSAAFVALDGLEGTELMGRSRLFWTSPQGGPPGQPDYLNAVARLETWLDPLELLQGLQAIEHQAGRQRRERWGPRTLDLDLLLYGGLVVAAPELILPHPRLAERAFVLVPLAEVAPEGLWIPGQGTLVDLLACSGRAGIRPLVPAPV
jgi:2-amino-4-hydroxy-6-hydroxymethyldihydropteridine diphosphokinase